MTMHGRTDSDVALKRLPLAASLLVIAAVLTACGGNDDKSTQAAASDVTAGAAVAGPTPFISFVPFGGASLNQVVSYRYRIAPKPGALSEGVDVTYTAAALASRGHVSQGTAKLPVFGLYSGFANNVTVELKFADGSRKEIGLSISAPHYTDPSGIFDQPTILKKRAAKGGLNYFYVKSSAAGPIVIDSDGAIRWVAPSRIDGFASAFYNNGFVLASATATTLARIELDGSTSVPVLSPSTYTRFHHNLDPGKVGLLAEVDGTAGGEPSIESVLLELAPSGTILKEWNFAEIFRRQMLDNGDDPSQFVRAGVDWFHINASTYDPRDDSIIASSRENFVVKVDYATGKIKWILGDPTKFWYTFPSLRAKALTLEAGGNYPIGQHATSISANGDLMLFNNGAQSFNQPVGAPVGLRRTYSAVSTYAIDPVAMTARETLHFDYGKTILSDVCSSAYEAKGGAVLASYATASNRTRARLVALDPQRNVMFDFEYKSQVCATSWNAVPVGFESMLFDR